MTAKKKILVLESEKLLTASIVSLLSSHAELDVMTTAKTTLTSLNNLNSERPDVVILDEGLLVSNISEIVKLVNRHPALRIIVFRLKDDHVQIFDKHMARVRHLSDFLSLL